MRDRFAALDLLLVFSATCVITLAVWPQAEKRRVFMIEKTSGTQVVRSLPTNDELMAKIEHRVDVMEQIKKSPAIALATWNQELQNFYENHPADGKCCSDAGCCEAECKIDGERGSLDSENADEEPTTVSMSDDVMTASFENTAARKSVDSPVQTADHNAVLGKNTKSESIRGIAASPALQLASFPVELGEISSPGKPNFAFHFALMLGVLLACGYKHWLSRTPVVASEKRQTTAVRIRRYTLVSGTSLAIFAAILLVLS